MNSVAFLMKVWATQCQPGEYVCVSAKGNTWSDRSFKWDENTESAVSAWLEANRTKNLYFCPLPFKSGRRRKELVTRSRFLWSDIDTGDWKKCPPTVLWQSSPGRYQGLWLLPEVMQPEQAEASSRQLAYAIGADRGGWDLTQALRIPGTPNLKYPERPTVKLEWWKDTVLKKIPQAPIERWRSTIPRKLLRIIEGPAEQGKRSDMLWYLEHELCDLGIPLKDVILILRDSEWNKYRGRADEDERFSAEVAKIRADRGEKQVETRIESRRLEVIQYADLMASQSHSPGWMIRDFWMRNSHGIVAGEPKSFKSTLVMDMLFAVASDTKFLGHYDVEFGGPVLIVQNENADWIMKDRLEKLAVSRGEVGKIKRRDGARLRIEWGRSLPIHFINQQGVMLDDAADKEALEELIDQLRPAAITLDPLYLMFAGDVNSAKDLSEVLQWCLYIKQKYGTSVILVHHYSKGSEGRGGQRMLGSTTLHGWIESAWYLQVQEPNGENQVITLEREFRGAGTYRKVDLEMQIGDFGEGLYQVGVSEHEDEREAVPESNLENDILDVMSNSIDLMSKAMVAKKIGVSRSKTDRLIELLMKKGRIYRHGERYGLTQGDRDER